MCVCVCVCVCVKAQRVRLCARISELQWRGQCIHCMVTVWAEGLWWCEGDDDVCIGMAYIVMANVVMVYIVKDYMLKAYLVWPI